MAWVVATIAVVAAVDVSAFGVIATIVVGMMVLDFGIVQVVCVRRARRHT